MFYRRQLYSFIACVHKIIRICNTFGSVPIDHTDLY